LLTNVTNPKAALFYSSVFAASFPPEPTHALQFAAVAVVVTNALCWYMALAYLFSRQGIRNAYAGARKAASRVTAVCFGAFGVGLLLSTYRAARA
jgi:threonine/homoserine/homoserine lactone efflux protein